MTALEETIPIDEEGATLLPKPKTTGIRRVVVGAALVSFVIGVLAATAVRTSPGRHASNLHSKHKHETTEVDDEGPHPYYWDDDDFPDDGIETEACDRKCTTDADCATEFPEFNHCGVCQKQWQIGDAPSPPPSGACNKACPSGKDSECSWLGGDNSCTKCDTTSGTQFKCVAP